MPYQVFVRNAALRAKLAAAVPAVDVLGDIGNIRGYDALAVIDGHYYEVEVLTHIRGNRWMVLGRSLPVARRPDGSRRAVVHVKDLLLIA